MRKTILALLAALPLSLMAAYVDVNYELDISPMATTDISYGYYYMLIDAQAFAMYDFNLLMGDSANLNNIPRNAILQESPTYSYTTALSDISSPVGADSVYFAVFNAASFGNDAYEYYYALSSINIEESTSYIYRGVSEFTKSDNTVNYTIPEPTSGLLVLVGASMLALKRRRV